MFAEMNVPANCKWALGLETDRWRGLSWDIVRFEPVAEVVRDARVGDQESLLVHAAQQGDRKAFSRLLRAHLPAMLDVARIFVQGDADDATQQAVEKVVRALASFDASRGSFRAWCLETTRNTCRDRLRQRNRKLAHEVFSETWQEAAAPERNPEQQMILASERSQLNEALSTLPEGPRAALILFYIHEASYEEIAQSLCVPIGTVMTWIHRGKHKLRATFAAQEKGRV